jgi:hypothetical protein
MSSQETRRYHHPGSLKVGGVGRWWCRWFWLASARASALGARGRAGDDDAALKPWSTRD